MLALLRSRRRILGRWLIRDLVRFAPQCAQSICQRRSQIVGSLGQALRLGDRGIDGVELMTDVEKLCPETPDARGFAGSSFYVRVGLVLCVRLISGGSSRRADDRDRSGKRINLRLQPACLTPGAGNKLPHVVDGILACLLKFDLALGLCDLGFQKRALPARGRRKLLFQRVQF